jgi:hypothetical protein
MNSQHNACLTPQGRVLMVRRITGKGWRAADAARAGLPFFTFSGFLQNYDTRINSYQGQFVLVVDFLALKYSADNAIVTGGAREGMPATSIQRVAENTDHTHRTRRERALLRRTPEKGHGQDVRRQCWHLSVLLGKKGTIPLRATDSFF